MEFKFYLSRLDSYEAELYSLLYDKILNREDSFVLNASVDLIKRVMKAVMLDNPNLFWFEGKWSGGSSDGGILVMPKYKQIEVKERELFSRIDAVTKNCVGTEAEKIKTAYDWIINNVRYGYFENDQTIFGALVDKTAVCKGIAKAFQAFMNRLEIPSFLVEGTLDGQLSHIWNVVYINERFYHIDVTMGYSKFGFLFKGLNRSKHYPCFLVSDKSIRATHRIYLSDLPEANEDFNVNDFLVKLARFPTELGSFDKIEYLDKGTNCIVFKATRQSEQYAIKVIESQRGFLKANAELEKLKTLFGCEGVVRLENSFIDFEKGKTFLVLEYLKPFTTRRKEADFLDTRCAVGMGIDLLNAMISCRDKGIYHLDIHPKNIFFNAQGKAVLSDFSEAKYERELSYLPRSIGTLAFMAPEVYFDGKYSQSSEIYSLGIILYSLFNNAKLPFSDSGDITTAINIRLGGKELLKPENADDLIWGWIKKACAFNVSDRFNSFEQARDALTEVEKC